MVAVADDCFDGQLLRLVMVIVAGVFVVVDVGFGGVVSVWMLAVAGVSVFTIGYTRVTAAVRTLVFD